MTAFDTESIPENCPRVAEMIALGDTKGVFQLETKLGRTWSMKLKPETIDHYAALVALLRPGCLDAKDAKGISTTEHYALRKNGLESVPSVHPLVDEILKDSYGLIIYQESYMLIAKELCNFTPGEVNKLRKATAKKDQQEASLMGELFIKKGIEAKKAPKELIEHLWTLIKASARYAFCAGHAYSYGIRSYQTAYLKCHYPLYFYTDWLSTAGQVADPQEEMRELVFDAKPKNILVLGPSLQNPKKEFSIEQDRIRFGIQDIRGIGEKSIEDVTAMLQQVKQAIGNCKNPPIAFLCSLLASSKKTHIEGLIQAGVFDGLGYSRKELLANFAAYHELPAGAKAWAKKTLDANPSLSMIELLEQMGKLKKEGGYANAATQDNFLSAARLLKNPPSSLKDTPASISLMEETTLGVALTATKAEGCKSDADTADIALVLTSSEGIFTFCAEVCSSKEVKTKNGNTPGQKMAFASLKDVSGQIEVTIFPEQWKAFSSLFRPGNTIRVSITKEPPSAKFNKPSCVVKSAHQAFGV